MSVRVLRAAARLAILSVVAALLVACGNQDNESTTTSRPGKPTSTSLARTSTTDKAARMITVSVAGGEVEGGARREHIKLGETVSITVTSDRADMLHVHGYDMTVNVTADTAGTVTFVADIPGVFEVELERSGLKVLEIEAS